jgi:hypothetical protein
MSKGIFDYLADKARKPDALGFQPIDPRAWATVVRIMERRK